MRGLGNEAEGETSAADFPLDNCVYLIVLPFDRPCVFNSGLPLLLMEREC